MKRALLTLRFEGFWHVGDGRSGGADLDALVRRTPGGLPVVPGRQLKGRLREALELAQHVGAVELADTTIEDWFGSSLPDGSDALQVEEDADAVLGGERRFNTRQGALVFDDATLGHPDDALAWEAWGRVPENARQRAHLFTSVSSTRIKDGLADHGSLRAIELTQPLTLGAWIQGPEAALSALAQAMPLLREIGANGTRGLGRVACGLEVQP